ncbi:hypothetical protein NPIL_309111 [Nephila pilipes]|uniref:Uncharacterized protein n=1 Tax=Nephila pilipes TaxID=299642 RepID=A0A8X6TCU6_NEPPI|nr:hypothetical protein NPIL_309111 [Nephila pilipes]
MTSSDSSSGFTGHNRASFLFFEPSMQFVWTDIPNHQNRLVELFLLCTTNHIELKKKESLTPLLIYRFVSTPSSFPSALLSSPHGRTCAEIVISGEQGVEGRVQHNSRTCKYAPYLMIEQ